MNFTKSLFVVALSGVLLTGCKQSDAAPADAKQADAVATTGSDAGHATQTASFTIDGMTCEVGCAKTIQKELAGMEGVENAVIDFEKKTATVKYDASKQTPEKLVEVVEAAADGKTYKVSNVKSSGDQAMVHDNDKEKGKKKKAKKKKDAKQECGPEGKTDGKPACCAAKKACHA
ncbi:MAG TPA: heavy-metal-associated domain-containing protein [Flavobacterium sp.]|jgi:Cu+-exporting ATPase